MASSPDPDTIARDRLGIRLRPPQRRAIAAAVEGRDVVAVLPTGSGKSAIYQVAGLAHGGTTVVVSPMIALQLDQVRSLHEHAIAAAAVNSSGPAAERTEALRRWRDGELDVVLLGPEQLGNEETRAVLRDGGRPVSLLAVDEAHLVSEWGHEFRPDYLLLGGVIDELGHPPVVALTATAAPPVRADIVRELRLRDPEVVVAGFDRPNISLAVRTTHARGREVNEVVEDAVIEEVDRLETPALVYAASRGACERIAERLRSLQYAAEPYHAGLSGTDRSQTQDAFLGGALDIVVATSAFGMGIDKPDVRSVVHAGAPGSVDEYYQEIGRAGRDGDPAHAVLVFDEKALRVPQLFASRARIDGAQVRRVVDAVLDADEPPAVAELAEDADAPRHTVERVVDELASSGLVRVAPEGVEVPPDERDELRAEGAAEVQAAAKRREAVQRSRIDAMRRYAETDRCRRATLLGYFGEQYAPPCDNCDNDDQPAATAGAGPAVHETPSDADAGGAPADTKGPERGSGPVSGFAAGDAVEHEKFGRGTVMSLDDHEVVVAFDDVGYKELTVAVLSNGLLRKV